MEIAIFLIIMIQLCGITLLWQYSKIKIKAIEAKMHNDLDQVIKKMNMELEQKIKRL